MCQFDLDAFKTFLIAAKKKGYASQGDNASIKPLIPGTIQLEYKDDAFLYRDVYVGTRYFVGQEIVYLKNKPIYSMCYSGGVDKIVKSNTDILKIYNFLQSALRKISKDSPFRGPDKDQYDNFEYFNKSDGSIELFSGTEHINLNDVKVYTLSYSGGFLI